MEEGFPDEQPARSSELTFTRRIYFYSETDISQDEIEHLVSQAANNGVVRKVAAS